MDWQTIESAPLDRVVLLYAEGEIGLGEYSAKAHTGQKYWRFISLETDTNFAEPIHWAPLPAHPEP